MLLCKTLISQLHLYLIIIFETNSVLDEAIILACTKWCFMPNHLFGFLSRLILNLSIRLVERYGLAMNILAYAILVLASARVQFTRDNT